MQLPYAALHQLLYPVLDRVDTLPELQGAALTSAFGLAPQPVPDRFLVAVSALNLMSDLAADPGLVCLVVNAAHHRVPPTQGVHQARPGI